MNIKWHKRALLIVHWVLSAAMFALLIALWIIQPSRDELLWFLPKELWLPVLIAAAVIYVVIAACSLLALVKRKNKKEDRGFVVVETSDSGKVRLSIPVIEQMVRQAAGTVEGVRDIKPAIIGLDDSIDVALNATMLNGVHVPTVTVNLQRAIRQYVELNCGITVHQVMVSILSVARPEENEHRLLKPMHVKNEKTVEAPEDEPVVAPVEEETPVVEPIVEAENTVYEAPEAVDEEIINAPSEIISEDEQENVFNDEA